VNIDRTATAITLLLLPKSYEFQLYKLACGHQLDFVTQDVCTRRASPE